MIFLSNKFKKKLIFIFLTFFIINSIFLINFCFIKKTYTDITLNKIYLSNNFKSYTINNTSENFQSLINVCKSLDNLVIEKSFKSQDNNEVTAVLFNKIPSNIPPLSSGEQLTPEETINTYPVSLIGKNLIKDTMDINGSTFIKINNINYEVKGILGYSNKDSAFDDSLIINLASLNKSDINDFSSELWKLDDTNNNLEQDIDFLENRGNIKLIEISLYNTDSNIINVYFSANKIQCIILLITLIIVIISMINFTNFFVNSKSNEIAIKKAFGATNINLYAEVLTEFGFISALSYILASLLVNSLIKLSFLSSSLYSLSLCEIVLVFFISLAIIILTSLIPLIFILKIQPIKIINGGKS